MIELAGQYNTAKIFYDDIDDELKADIINLLNQPFVAGSKIRFMPDLHRGKGVVIGTTMTITDKVVPNFVGVDIGCGVHVIVFKTDAGVNLAELDWIIRKYIPSGREVHDHAVADFPVTKLNCIDQIRRQKRHIKSIGTLGGGNHFIELSEGSGNTWYLQIHSGSRNLGLQVATLYQNTAFKEMNNIKSLEIMESLGRQNCHSEIQKELNKNTVAKNMAYCEGILLKHYLEDMELTQAYTMVNREIMAERILVHMSNDIEIVDRFTTVHNYIDTDEMILRKGAVSAQKDERLIIPMNMRDGSLLCLGKGNPDWNYSAPHGAGRLMSRRQARDRLKMVDYKKAMAGIYTTSVASETIDEAPSAYKDMNEIISHIGDTVEIIKILKPVYNFKAKE